MRKIALAVIILLIAVTGFSQDPAIVQIANTVSTSQLKKNLYFLASDAMEGRAMSSHADTLASRFIAQWYKDNQLRPPYPNNSYYQAITAVRKTIGRSELIIGDNKYKYGDGWYISLRNAETTFLDNLPTTGATDSNYEALNVKGKIVLAENHILSAAAQNILKEKGAALLLQVNHHFDADLAAQRKNAWLPT